MKSTIIIIIIVLIIGIVCIKLDYIASILSGKVWDYAWIHSAKSKVFYPKNISELLDIIINNPSKKISIAGGKYSHGGHTMLDDSICVEMKNINKMVLSEDKKHVIVQAGATWYMVQQYLDKYNLSVSEMQSYNNFQVGGSISVNCHGRGLEYGTISDTIKDIKILTLYNNKITFTSPEINYDLFRASIGGYGGIGIIVEATLKVNDNYQLVKKIVTAPRSKYLETFEMLNKNDLVFYNANIYPKNEDEVMHIGFYKTKNSEIDYTSIKDRLQPHRKLYLLEMLYEQLLRRTHVAKYIRAYIEPKIMTTNKVIWKNYEMSYDVQSLEPLVKFPTTSILQEYFIPVHNIEKYLDYFWNIIKIYKVNLINLSIRYVKKSTVPILNYAPEDRFALVLYFNIWNTQNGLKHTQMWTRYLIDGALYYGGKYYLPYLPFATITQFRSAYTDWNVYLQIKHKYDPNNRLSNQFLNKYFYLQTK